GRGLIGGRGLSGRVPQEEEEEEEEEERGQGGGAKAPGLGGGRRYVPPRLVPVSCDPAPDPESRSRSRLRLRALSSAALRELRQELGEGPLEEGAGLQPPQRQEIQRFPPSPLKSPIKRRGLVCISFASRLHLVCISFASV
ncbi:neuroguidin-like, partial [Cyanistes caeruleus]|uniref:neuroguidin-like n=1 Tax=Cyanistes caeruleus TaxID=156563 RepID=UPI000CDB7D45